jgi:hypothetical protein
MNELSHAHVEALADEIARYLAIVELFRALGCEPTWRPEVGGPRLADEPLPSTLEASAH